MCLKVERSSLPFMNLNWSLLLRTKRKENWTFWGSPFSITIWPAGGRTKDLVRKIYFEILSFYMVIPPPWYKGGGGGWWNPSLGFLICCNYISKRFCLQWKPFGLLYKMRCIFWVVALLEVCDVTRHGHYLSRHLGFYQELKIRFCA